MKLKLSRPPSSIKGIYADKKSGRKDFLPDRLRMLDPRVAAAFAKANAGGALVISDMFRSADGSLEAVRTRRGALRPSKSLHNYGLAIDIDVTKVMKTLRLKTKQALDEYMAQFDFICCRLDHKREFEEWHYSFIPGFDWESAGPSSTDDGEAEIQRLYKKHWDKLGEDVTEEQKTLQKLRLYGGAIDGDPGPRTARAREAFCAAWEIPGPSDPLYYRTLALVAADIEMV